MESFEPARHREPPTEPDPRRWIALAVVLTAAFMQLVDISIVNVAIPSIQRDLGATYGEIELVIAFYQLAFAALLITGGRLGDIAGRRRMFMIGLTGFTLASLACGLARSPDLLVVARVVQGSFSAMMFPQVAAVIQTNFPVPERGAAFGVLGATIGLATIMGPLLGGVLIDADVAGLDWRPIFLVNIPVGVAALGFAARFLPESRADRPPKLDLVGVALVTLALGALVYPLVEGRSLGWPWWSFATMAAGGLLLGVFALVQRRKGERGEDPLVPPALFADRAFTVGLLTAMVFFLGVGAYFLTFSLWLQIGLGFDPLGAGLAGLPFAVGSALGSAASVRLVPRLGNRALLVGAAMLTLGMLGVMGTIELVGTGLRGWQLAPVLLVCGLGMGQVIAPLLNAILAGVQRRNAGAASGVLSTANQVGGAVGVAVVGVLFFTLLASAANGATATVVPQVRRDLAAAGVPAPEADRIVRGFAACARDRADSSDPTAEPASCRALGASQAAGRTGADQPPRASGTDQAVVGRILAAAGVTVREDTFTSAFQRVLIWEVIVFAVTFMLLTRLPTPERPARPEAPAAARSATGPGA
jgi:EmrB/QacA subfamily drug resistance transporter